MAAQAAAPEKSSAALLFRRFPRETAMIFVLTVGFLGLVLARLWRGSKGGLRATNRRFSGGSAFWLCNR